MTYKRMARAGWMVVHRKVDDNAPGTERTWKLTHVYVCGLCFIDWKYPVQEGDRISLMLGDSKDTFRTVAVEFELHPDGGR